MAHWYIFCSIESALGFGVNFRRHLNCWSESCICVCWLSASETVPPTDYFSGVIADDFAASFRSMESEKTVKRPMGRPRKCLLESNGHTCRRKPMKTIDVPADNEETTSVKSVRYQYTMKSSSVSLKGHLAFRERTSNIGWRAFMTDPTRLCRHGIPSLCTAASTHLHSLPLTAPNSNFPLDSIGC